MNSGRRTSRRGHSWLARRSTRRKKIHKMAERAVVAVMLGKGLASAEMRELIHLLHALHHAGHTMNEVADKVLDGPRRRESREHRPSVLARPLRTAR
jgi:hypothetical protein